MFAVLKLIEGPLLGTLILTMVLSSQALAAKKSAPPKTIQSSCESFASPTGDADSADAPHDFKGNVHFESFLEKNYRNGELLLSFFSPTGNALPEWLRWLESKDNRPPPTGPSLFYSSNGLVLSRKMTFPFDFGRQFANEEPRIDMVNSILRLGGNDVANYRGDSPEAQAGRKRIETLLDEELFGVYSSANGVRWESNHLYRLTTISGDHVLKASISPYPFRGAVRETLWGPNIEDLNGPSVVDDFNKVVHIVSQNEDATIIKVSMDSIGDNANQSLIRRMFFITYWQMVQRAYRESRLFPNEFRSAVYLLDDFIETMKTSGPQQDLYMMYDSAAWSSMVRRMRLAHRYVAVAMQGLGLQPFVYQTIPDVFAPLYPIYGLTAERYPTGELEVKRLFHNSNPDPLKVLSSYSTFPDGRGTNMHFYHSIANQLEPGQRLVASSKTKIHTRLYRGLGFELVSSEFKPEWGTNKDTLASTREKFLESTKAKDSVPNNQ